MKAVRQQGTEAERAVRAALSKAGVRYRMNVKSLPGSPDVVNATRKFAIFVHGCFWHRHARCPFATMPKTNTLFWREKFAANVRRDRRKTAQLRRQAFRVLVVWECQARRKALGPTVARWVRCSP
jgi:DNA mismatch endonuclease (patch repair protein)